MVLQSRRNLENAHPQFLTHSAVKSVGHRIRSSIQDPARRRRVRVARSTDHAKRRTKTSKPPSTLQFNVTSVAAPPIMDVEMRDAEAQPSLTTQTYRLPRELLRPEFQEVSKETLLTIEPDLGADELPEIEYIQEIFEDIGPGLLRAVVSVVADPPKDALPAEIAITVNDHSDYPPPTHILAIHGRASKDTPGDARRQVTLIPAHSVVLALHCARLPKLAPSIPSYTSADRTQLVVPVQPLCLPSPATFSFLSTFLYTKRVDHLLKSLLPCPPPPKLDADRTLLPAFGARLAGTYTSQALLLHVNSVHGLWQNACVLGVFVDELWDTIDLAWEVLLTAMAISAGTPHLMLKRPSSPPLDETPVVPASEVAPSPSGPDPDCESVASTPTPVPAP